MKVSRPCLQANSNAPHDDRQVVAFSAGSVPLKKPSGGPKGLIGPPCHGAVFKTILAFELTYKAKKMSTYIYFGIFFLIGFIVIARTSVGGGPLRKLLGAGMGNIHANAPYVLYYLITLMSHFGLLITAAFFGKAAYRDFKQNTYELYFSYPLRKIDYLAGRFVGALLSTLFVFSGVGLGALLASLSPFVNPGKIAPINLLTYIQPYLAGVIPNVLFAGILFFSLALVTRKFFPVYTGIVAILITHLVGKSLFQSQHHLFASLIDPLGNIAAGNFYTFWTAAEKNSLLIPLSGNFLFNRLIWLGLAVLLAVIAYKKFQFSSILEPKTHRFDLAKPVNREQFPMPTLTVTRVFSFMNSFKQMLHTVFLEFKGLIKQTSFLIILLLGMAFILIVGFKNVGLVRGTQSYPVTFQVLDTTKIPLYLFCLVIVLFASGELVWRERNRGVQGIYDALPVPEWVPFLGKLGALILVQLVMMLMIMFSGIVIQVLHGYTHFELGLYVKELLGIRLIYYILISIFAMFIQVMVNKKFFGYVLAFLFIDDFFPSLGFEHHLWNFASIPAYTYSDMNGYGPFVKSILVFNLYWSVLAVLLIVFALLFWVRGKDWNWRARFKLARTRLTRAKCMTAAASVILCLVFGGYILYNTTILNRFEAENALEAQQAQYEKKYKNYEERLQPRITRIKTDVDIYPYRRKVHSKGRLVLENQNAAAIRDVLIQMPKNVTITRLSLGSPRHVMTAPHLLNSGGEYDKTHGVYIYRLSRPLAPGEKINLDFDLEISEKGFKNHGENTHLVSNGSFLYYNELIPAIGYDPYFLAELKDNDKRKKYGLAPKERIPSITDEKAKMNTPLGRDGTWVDFEATVSTAEDQIALAPGALIKEWVTGKRRYFHYKTREKVLKYFCFISAVYEVKREHWQDVDIEIYYHKGHDYNVALMIEAVKKSLDYFTVQFSPYQFKHLRIVEFPRYELYGEAFPGLIPVSEGYGFIAKFDPSKVAYAFRVTAHEVAHQWWAHQVIGANVQGMFVLSEVMAQYSALMVTKKEYPQTKISGYIKERIAGYLKGRARETEKEVPLLYTNFETAYLNYEKGMVVMNALQDYIGEANLNTALKKYIRAVAFQEAPFTTSLAWLQYVREVTPEHLKYIINDMFETITLYENKALKATYGPLSNGKYRVKLTFEAHKYRADELGNETEIAFNDWLTFAVSDEQGEALYSGKHWVRPGIGELEFVVDRVPAKAGIDPYYFLVDKHPGDNVIEVSGE